MSILPYQMVISVLLNAIEQGIQIHIQQPELEFKEYPDSETSGKRRYETALSKQHNRYLSTK
jgi:hypothetical protein